MKKKINYHEHDTDQIDNMNVASATEYTGLIQTPPQDKAQLESYEELTKQRAEVRGQRPEKGSGAASRR